MFEKVQALWLMLFGFFPGWFQAGLLGILAIMAIILVMRITAFVLDTIPFM